jgi:hypothetical protein
MEISFAEVLILHIWLFLRTEKMSGTNLIKLLQLYTFVQLFKEKLRINILHYVTNIYF